MRIDPEKGVFGWYRPAEGLRLTLRAEWRPRARGAARPVGLELTHFDAEEGSEAPIEFSSIRSMAEFLARHGEAMNDGLNQLAAWGGLEVASGLAASWPAAGGGEARLRFGPLGPEAAREPPPARPYSAPAQIYSAPAQIYDHEAEAEARPGADPRAEVAAIVLRKILEERERVNVALRRARAEVGGFPGWTETIGLLEAESLEWKRVANALYGGAVMESPEVRAVLEAAVPRAPEKAQEPPGAPGTDAGAGAWARPDWAPEPGAVAAFMDRVKGEEARLDGEGEG